MSAILSFLSGSAFRMIWGEASAFITKRQDHKYELERLAQQAEFEERNHARNLESMRLQSELGIKLVEVQREAHTAGVEDDAWLEAVRGVNKQSGVQIIDGWNAAVRPAFATLVFIGMLFELYTIGWLMNDWYREFAGVVIGVYFADRSLRKRGK